MDDRNAMAEPMFDGKYFERYLSHGKLSGKLRGDKRDLHAYWLAWLRRRLPPGGVVLEIGCGLGFFGKRLQAVYRYAGLDISPEAITYAREVNGVVSLIQGSADLLPFGAASADALCAFDVVEHLHHPSLFLRESFRVLRPGGITLITTPNTESLGVRLKPSGGELVASMHTDTSHVALLPPAEWKDLLREAGFVIQRWGTDSLWDMPYTRRIPLIIQKVFLIPFNIFVTRWIGVLPWRIGENLVIVARKP